MQRNKPSITSGFNRPLIWVLVYIACANVQAESEPNPVARATLVLGASVVHYHHRAGEVQLRRGDPVYAGDLIETQSNGHVHLRFQ